MSIQRYDLNDYGEMNPYQSGDYVLFTDHAAALAAKEAGAREAAFRAFIQHRGVDVPCQSCRGLGTRLYGSTATWHGGAGGQTVTTDICDRCWGSGDEERHGVNLRTLATKDAEVAAQKLRADAAELRLHRDAARLADEVAALVRRGVVDSRSPVADALLDFREPPSTARADRLADRDADIERLKIAGEAMRRALVCFNIRRHPRTSRSHDESERVVDAWDLARAATSRPAPGALVTAVDFAGGPDRAAVVTMQDGKIVSVGEHPATTGTAKEEPTK